MLSNKLANGIEFVYIPAKTFYNTVVIGTKSGFSFDPADKPGLTHLYEHVLISMLNKLYKYGENVEKSGFSQNAFTYNGAMVIYFEQQKNKILKTLKLFKNIIENFYISNDVFEIEKEAVKNESSDHNKDYDSVVLDFVKLCGFESERNTRVETIESINKLSMLDVLKWHSTVFSNNGIIVILYGDVVYSDYENMKILLSSIRLNDYVKPKYPKIKKTNNTGVKKISNRLKKLDTGIFAFNIKNPTFTDYLCERIYKDTMIDYDDSLLFDFIRNRERASYTAYYNDIDGVGERVFYFSFASRNKRNLVKTMNTVKNPKTFFRQNEGLFKKGKKRALLKFYGDASNQSDFSVDLAYYYILYGKILDIYKIRNRLLSIKYADYIKWLNRLKYKKIII